MTEQLLLVLMQLIQLLFKTRTIPKWLWVIIFILVIIAFGWFFKCATAFLVAWQAL